MAYADPPPSSPLAPSAPPVLWLAEALRAERVSLSLQLERRHRTMLAGLEAQLGGSAETDDPFGALFVSPLVDVLAKTRSRGDRSVLREVTAAEEKHEMLAPVDEGPSPDENPEEPVPVIEPAVLPPFSQAIQLSKMSPREEKEEQECVISIPEQISPTQTPTNKPPLRSPSMYSVSTLPPQGRPRNLAELVNYPGFEILFSVLIVLSTVVMAVQAQYNGVIFSRQLGHGLQSTDNWVGAETTFEVFDALFGFLFISEMLVKIGGMRMLFITDPWNAFDSLVNFLWLLSWATQGVIEVKPSMLRLLRLSRLMRILRLVKFVQALDSLHLLIGSITACVSVLVWSCVLLLCVFTVGALVLNNAMADFLANEDHSDEDRLAIFMYFGSFTRSMLTLCEVTIGNWVPVTRQLTETVSEWYALVFVAYQLIVGSAVVKVITGVFLHETFKVAASDDELMIMQKERQAQKHTAKMTRLFNEIDGSGDGALTWDEFLDILSDPRVKTWLSAMDLNTDNVRELFGLLDSQDGGDHKITAPELVDGIEKLRGPAKSYDLAQMNLKIIQLARTAEVIEAQVDRIVGVACPV